MSSFIKLNMDDRVVLLRGTFPNSKVREYIAKGHASRLWREILWMMTEFYPSSILDSVEITGDAQELIIENHVPSAGAPIKAYGLHI